MIVARLTSCTIMKVLYRILFVDDGLVVPHRLYVLSPSAKGLGQNLFRNAQYS